MNFQIITILLFLSSHTQKDFLLSPKHVGSLSVGSYVEGIYHSFDKEKETQLIDRYFEASFSPALTVTKNGELLFYANIDCNKIRSFEIVSPKFKTMKGISVGSSYADLKKIYKVTAIENQEGIFYASVKELEMLFMLDPEKMLNNKKGFSQDLSVNDVEGTVKLTSIIIY